MLLTVLEILLWSWSCNTRPKSMFLNKILQSYKIAIDYTIHLSLTKHISMKKLTILLACLLLISIACKKQSSTTPSQVQSSSSLYSHADSLISGNWILDTVKVYNNGLAPV